MTTRARWVGAVALFAAGMLTACSSSDERALVILNVMVAGDVPAFETLRFTSPSSPSIAPRDLDGPSHRALFRLGYYVSNPPANVVITGRAVAAGGCIVAEGTSTVTGVQTGKQVNGGTLTIAKLAAPNCSGDGGMADGGGDSDSGGNDLRPDAGDDVRSDTASDLTTDSADARMDVATDATADVPTDGRGDASVDVTVDAPADVAADAPSDVPPKLGNGQPCTTAASAGNCQSGKCVDGVCCESDCAGACRRCNASGVCAAVNSGTDPGTCEGDFVCNAGTCGCPSPKTACGNTCKDLATDPSNCRTCGTICAAPPANGAGVCLGAAGCGVQCQSGHLACGGLCCDTPPTNAFATCPTANQCGIQCNATYHACNGAQSPCYSDTDVTHCGPSCLDCRQPNATAACGPTQCANTCNGLTLSCPGVGGKPNCGSWDFESGTVEGWSLDVSASPETNASDGTIATSARQAVLGSRSLALGFNGNGSSRYDVRVRFNLCSGGQSLNLTGKSLVFHLRLERTSSTPLVYGNGAGSVQHGNGQTTQFTDFTFEDPTQWVQVGTPITQLTEYFEIIFNISVPWSGTIFIDDVAIR